MSNVTEIKPATRRSRGAREVKIDLRPLDEATMYLSQAKGVLHIIAVADPIADEMSDGEVSQAIYAAIDQIQRSCDMVSAYHQQALEVSRG